MIKCYQNNICKVFQLKVWYQSIINYTYIIVDASSHECVIVDPAWNLELIRQIIEKENIHLKYIAITHYHFDHMNLVEDIYKMYSCKVIVSEDERHYYHFNIQEDKIFYITQNEKIRFSHMLIHCIPTPGHTIGSLCYMIDDFLFTGDTIFIEGVGICEEYKNAPGDMYDSVQRIGEKVPKKVIVLPGHKFGKEFGLTLEEVIKNNIYFHIDCKEKFTEFRMRKNRNGLFNFK